MQRQQQKSYSRCYPSKGVRNASFYFLVGFIAMTMMMRQLSIIRSNYNQLTSTISTSLSSDMITDSMLQQMTSSIQKGEVANAMIPPTKEVVEKDLTINPRIQQTSSVLQPSLSSIQEKIETDLISSSIIQLTAASIQEDEKEAEARTNIQELFKKYQYHPPESRSLIEIVENATAICGTFNNSFQSFWSLDSTKRSRLDEDKKIYNIFFQQILDYTSVISEDFHYVELGAFDGMGESNTRFYDVCLGWTGLLIEPNPKVYPKLVQNRPNAHRMSYAPSCHDTDDNNQTVTFYASIFTNAAEDNSPNREAYVGSDLDTEVPCGGLHPVLINVFPSKRIHFFSLDTEGVEYSILQTIDFSDVFIDIFIIENWNNFCRQTCPGRENVRSFMQSKGYLLYHNTIQFSDLYVHPQSEFASQINA
jgi:FkbM family methyltransferase